LGKAGFQNKLLEQTKKHLHLFSITTLVSRHQKGNPFWISMKQEMTEWQAGCGIKWTACKSSAPCLRMTTMPASHHSVFAGRILFLTSNQQCRRTESKAV